MSAQLYANKLTAKTRGGAFLHGIAFGILIGIALSCTGLISFLNAIK